MAFSSRVKHCINQDDPPAPLEREMHRVLLDLLLVLVRRYPLWQTTCCYCCCITEVSMRRCFSFYSLSSLIIFILLVLTSFFSITTIFDFKSHIMIIGDYRKPVIFDQIVLWLNSDIAQELEPFSFTPLLLGGGAKIVFFYLLKNF